jgi:DNA-directed RNA polymerase specialized sigma24 family protein
MTLGMTMNDPDGGLVSGVRRHDLCAVQLLVSRKFHRLAALFAGLMNGSNAETEALATQVLRTAQYMIDSYDEHDLLFDTWLHKLAINLWREAYTKPVDAKAKNLMALDERSRICLVLSAFQGMQAREIARLMSLSIQEIERTLKTARQTLSRNQLPQSQAKGAPHAA